MVVEDQYWRSTLSFEKVCFIDCRNADELEANGSLAGALHLPCRMSDKPMQIVKDGMAKLPAEDAMPILLVVDILSSCL